MESFDIDCLIIGGGVAGVATARNLSEHYKDIFLIEKNKNLAEETSSRNSEVIHAGIYYKKDSLKSRLCIEGKELLYEYLMKHEIPFNKCGKFIISTSPNESRKLGDIYKNAKDCGVDDLLFTKDKIDQYSFLNFHESLFSPSTGIFDSYGYIESLKNEFQSNGGHILLENECKRIEVHKSCFSILISDTNSQEDFIINTKRVINSAGLNASKISNALNQNERFKLKLIKGEYYSYSGGEKLNHLIYPLPTEESLGIHATIDIGGAIRFGPSAYPIDNPDYSFSEEQRSLFYDAIRRYWPEINKDKLTPSYTGIRAKILDYDDDFVLDQQEFDENLIISVLSYISPGLTSSLSLAKLITNNLINH